jgi:hypothetical protein
MAVLEGSTPIIATENMDNLFLFCEEFDFAALSSIISNFSSEYSVVVDKAEKSADRGADENSFVSETFCSLREAILCLHSKYVIIVIQ